MNQDVSTSFVSMYQAEVMHAYQQTGSKLRHTVRVKSGVVGASTKFPRIGKGQANQKTRHAAVTAMAVDHSLVTCQIGDWYAPDYIDRLDEFKLNYNERQALVQSGAYAIGRKVDDLIIQAASTPTGLDTANIVGNGSESVGLESILNAYARLNEMDVPDDGQRYALVGPMQWNALLRIRQFASAEYVGNAQTWLQGADARRWLNTTWIMHSGLNQSGSGSDRFTTCLWYHKSAVGWAENSVGVISEINYVPEKVSWLANNMIGGGACRIDPDGVVLMNFLNRGYVADPEFSVSVNAAA